MPVEDVQLARCIDADVTAVSNTRNVGLLRAIP